LVLYDVWDKFQKKAIQKQFFLKLSQFDHFTYLELFIFIVQLLLNEKCQKKCCFFGKNVNCIFSWDLSYICIKIKMRNGRNKTTLNGKERNSLVTLETGFNMINRNNNHIIIIIIIIIILFS